MFKVTINTDEHKNAACSKKNWEPGTINDLMFALNGWESIENNEQELKWRIMMFRGCDYSPEEGFEEWYKNPKNKITYLDRICGFERTHDISPYGFKLGYFDIDEVIKQVKEKGVARVPFSWVYDIRQHTNRGYDKCYMEITML